MKKLFLYIICASALLMSCNKDGDVTCDDNTIRIEVYGATSISTRAHLYYDPDELDAYKDIKNEGQFKINAHLDNANNDFYIGSTGTPGSVTLHDNRWRFQNTELEGNLVDFYWPNNSALNFMAYIPATLSECAAEVSNIAYTKSGGFTFSAVMPQVINDRTEAERLAEHARKEFIYATRLAQNKEASVMMRFVHPFAVVKFRLSQSHRDLTIHDITLHNMSREGTFADGNDTMNEGQSALTTGDWTGTDASQTFTVNLEKNVPDDVNYGGSIGGPYLVIPQNIEDVTLTLKYSWDTKSNVTTTARLIATPLITEWQPGYVYTYVLDLGDNKEEVLFSVSVEEWIYEEYEQGYELK